MAISNNRDAYVLRCRVNRGAAIPTGWVCLIVLAGLVAACSGSVPPTAESASQAPAVQSDEAKGDDTMELMSTAFAYGEAIPVQYTCDGANYSPPLAWSNVPAGAQSLALICDDPDAPGRTWVHWVIYNLSPLHSGLPEGVAAKETVLDGAVQGSNDFKKIGYGGPCPPRGAPHRYFFKLYALDAKLALGPRATKQQTLQAMEGHIVAQVELMGTYKRR